VPNESNLYRMAGIGEICVGVRTNYVCPFHTHDTYSIGIFRGPAQIVCRGGAWAVEDADIVLLEPYEPHRGTSVSRTCVQDGILPDIGCMTALFGSPNPFRIPRHIVRDPVLASELSRAAAGADGSAMLALLRRLFQSHGQRVPEAGAARAKPSGSALRAALAAAVATSRSQGTSRWRVARKMRRDTGLSPRDLKRQLRVAHARGLIEEGEALADAALRAGFSDQAHMTRQLRSLLGVTPAALRRRLNR
jgi:AraC-like DNA-binding protein